MPDKMLGTGNTANLQVPWSLMKANLVFIFLYTLEMHGNAILTHYFINVSYRFNMHVVKGLQLICCPLLIIITISYS